MLAKKPGTPDKWAWYVGGSGYVALVSLYVVGRVRLKCRDVGQAPVSVVVLHRFLTSKHSDEVFVPPSAISFSRSAPSICAIR